MFFSASTGGFYSRDIHGDNMPVDVVEITVEQHAALIEGHSQGKVISADVGGRPVLQDPPAPTPEQEQERISAEARAYLAETDWYVIRLQETGEHVPDEILSERAAARARVVE